MLTKSPRGIKHATTNAQCHLYGGSSAGSRRHVDYIARDSVQAAESWLRETRSICDLLAVQPAIGQRVPSKRSGEIRRHAFGNYLIYYEPMPYGIDVVRIVHGARRQEKLL